MTYTVSFTRSFDTLEDAVAYATTELGARYDADKVEALEQGARSSIILTTAEGDEITVTAEQA